MVYITADGSVDGGRSRSRNPFKLLANLLMGLINGILLFVRTISTPPERLPEGQRRTTYNERQGIRRSSSGGGANIRGMKKLGDPKAMAGGGG
eukprot:CAMPEP_0185825614 /NCGR_PEP_ID=MMETSP1322-20130828/31134_1 /TAXON_ID=265543 /ORGANISM="Minutocellus polymorphus, Strain RCC2270" /LENGTH=92 /DNA_ID=CAMNT_0028523337 /DNA_START=16 /DNA_END=294 /DNA_ORIENTATION=+